MQARRPTLVRLAGHEEPSALIVLAPEVRSALHEALSAFSDDDRFAVRSSAQDEDSSRHSFAGQLESYLGIEKGRRG